MAFTALGFDGSIGEFEFSLFQQLAGHDECVGGLFDFRVTQSPGARAVRVAAGRAYKNGVWVESSQQETHNFPTPDAGQWSLIAIRRDWQNNSISLEVLPGVTTSTAAPVAPPTVLPGGFRSEPGIVEHQAIYWGWSNAGSTTITLIDLRKQPDSWKGRGTAAERDAVHGAPTSVAAQRALQLSGATWERTDRAWTERYFAPRADDFPGGIQRGAAGWYPVGGKMPFWEGFGDTLLGISHGTWFGLNWYTTNQYDSHGPFTYKSGDPQIAVPYAGLWNIDVMARIGGSSRGTTRGVRIVADGKSISEQVLRVGGGFTGSSLPQSVSATAPVTKDVFGGMYQDSGGGLNTDFRRLRLAYQGPF